MALLDLDLHIKLRNILRLMIKNSDKNGISDKNRSNKFLQNDKQ